MNRAFQDATQSDPLRALIDSVLADPRYQIGVANDPWAPVRRLWLATIDAIDTLRASNPMVYKLLVWSLIAVLAAIVAHAVWIAAKTIRAGSVRTPERIKEVSSKPRDALWYANEAERLASSGMYPEAMQADFLRLMLELDARNLTVFHPSKTPAEYVRDVELPEAPRAELRELVRYLYACAFGSEPAGLGAWESWKTKATSDRYAPAH